MERRHDEHVAGRRKAAERILLHDARIERHIGRHFAVIFEIDAAPVEDLHRLPHPLRTLARGMAEGRIGEHGDARLVAEAAGKAGSLFRDIGQFLRGRHVVHGGVGDEHGAPAAERERGADHPVAGLGVDAAAHVLQRGGVVAREARHHRVRIAERHHAGGEMVAVVVDQALGVAVEEALALQAGIEIVDIGVVARGDARVQQLDARPVEIDAGALGDFAHPVVAADEDRRAELLVGVGDGGAHHLLFFALGEDDALGLAAHPRIDLLERRGDGVAPGLQVARIGVEVRDVLARDAGFHRGLGDGDGDCRDEARIERHGDDVLRPEARAHALVGGGHVVRHVLLGELGERFGGGDLHRVVDRRCAHVERAAEDIGKAQHVVDLVRIVRTAGRDDGVVADAGDLFRRDLRIGIGHGEDDRPRRHGADHLFREGALGRKAEDDVRAGERVGERPAVGLDRMGRLPLVHALFAALVDHALGVAEDDVVRRKAHRLDELDAGDGGRARAVAHELRRLEVAARQRQRIDEAGGGDDGGAVLVVVEDGDVHQFAQALLDDEAVGRLDVFEVDAAEGGAEVAHAVYELVDILGVDLEVDGIDVGEALEEDGLAFHHGLGSERPEIAEAEDGGAVRDDGDHVAARRVVVGGRRILGDGLHRYGDAR